MSTPTTAAPVTSAAPATATQPTATTAAQPNAQPAKTQAAPEKTFKIKVDGVEQSVTESELISLAQKGKGADKKFNEAANAKKEALQIIDYLKTHPTEAFQKLGIDVRKFSEDTLLEMIKQEKMSPAEKTAADNEARLRKYEAAEKAQKEKLQKDEQDRLFKQEHDKYEKSFMEALNLSGLPKTSFTMRRMAELEVINVKKGLSLEPAQLAKLVREDYEAEHRNLYANFDGEALLNLLGKDGVKKLSKAQLAKLKTGQQPVKTQTQPKKAEPAEYVDDWKAFKNENRKKRLYK